MAAGTEHAGETTETDMTERISRIVGGADSACVLAMMDALGSVLNATDATARPHLIATAKTALRESMGKRINLDRPGCQSHLDQMLETIDMLGVSQAPVEAAPIDVDALILTSLNDIDLNDENNFTKGDLERFLSEIGQAMAERYACSEQAFWLERTIYKGQHYLGIGTSSGPHPRFPGQDFNIFCTTQGYRTIKDADADLVVFSSGRQLTLGHDHKDRSYFIRFVPISSEKSWRFWASTNKDGERKDVESLKFTIQLKVENPKGYVVTRMKGRTIRASETHAQTN